VIGLAEVFEEVEDGAALPGFEVYLLLVADHELLHGFMLMGRHWRFHQVVSGCA